MKQLLLNKKLTASLVVLLMAAGLVGCGSDDNEKDKLYYTWEEPGIEFWQGKGVTDAKMDTLINVLKASYANEFNAKARESFSENLTEIRVKSDGAGVSHQGKILTVGNDTPIADIGSYLISNGIIQLSKFLAPTKGAVVKNTKNDVKFKAIHSRKACCTIV